MQDAPLFFSGWETIGRTVVLGLTSYVALVFLLRVSGKRTLSKMNMFDLVITVAFGSTLASMLVSKTVALAQGVTAFAMLIALQYVVTWFSVRSEKVQSLVKAQPSILYYKGHWYDDRLRNERITKEELRSAARQSGIGSMDDVGALILETDGSVSVIQASKMGAQSTLPDRDRKPSIERSQ
ncbi:DUF421 domain-containing protein [Parvularcula oceani]|uniref:DUF421 domain-containing protein n=1 Tax=Parvularcula oceani TaxID=1247963 RepID=UPI00056B439F|nr:YetF domain-containing protein [Parvularcula oceani]